MRTASPYLNFPGNAEEAFNFYKTVFGAEFAAVMRFRDLPGNPMGIAENDLDRIAHIALPLTKDVMLMATDVVGAFGINVKQGNNFYIMLDVESADEADRLFNALSAGGAVEMELQKTLWAAKYGTCSDRYGVQWMVNFSEER